MSGGSGSGENFQTSQNIGTAFLANLFGQGAGFGPEGVVFGGRGGFTGSPTTSFNSSNNSNGPLSGIASQFNSIANLGPGSADALGGINDFIASGSTQRGGLNFANQVFGPDDFNILRNILNPTASNSLQGDALGMGQMGTSAFGDIFGSANSAVQEGLDSGFRTDMQPIIEAEKRRFSRETVPGLMEQYAGLTGGFSSATSSGLANAASDLGISLGSQQAQFDEAANNRRLQSLSVAQSIANLPFDVGNQSLGLGAQIQEDQYLSRPEIQLMRTLSNLFSLSPPTTGASGSSSSKQGGL